MFEFTYDPIPDLDPYLERIGYTGSKEPTLENLHQLVRCHQIAVPFESLNLSLFHVPVSLKEADLYQKVVVERRGGYCFELNGLFGALLRAMGYNAWSTMVRLVNRMRPVLGGISHRGTIVLLDGKYYFCDVGYGGAMAPFAVELSEEKHTVFGETYWAEPSDRGWFMVKRQRGAGYCETGEGDYEEAPVALVGLQPFLTADFNAYNALTSAPTSGFSMRIWCSRRTESGYMNLMADNFTVMENGVKTERKVTNDEILGILKDYYGIVPPEGAEVAFPPPFQMPAMPRR